MEDILVHRVDRTALCDSRQVQPLDERCDARDIRLLYHAEARADVRRADHADGNGFDGMRHRVAEVQDAAQAALLLVLADDGCLDLARARDHVDGSFLLEREHGIGMLLKI